MDVVEYNDDEKWVGSLVLVKEARCVRKGALLIR
jgi:hypothetical protein